MGGGGGGEERQEKGTERYNGMMWKLANVKTIFQSKITAFISSFWKRDLMLQANSLFTTFKSTA